MVARGEVYGLLMVQSDATDGERLLQAAMPVASALADAMSLALSNIALREKLRTQALRDPLTSLYNRRYMEDALERYANLAERSQTTLSVVMFDLDFFKKVNDEHGHAVGDAILTEVASSVVGAIRPCDIACRYGGEEFVILFPGSSLLETVAKAEVLRARIDDCRKTTAARSARPSGSRPSPRLRHGWRTSWPTSTPRSTGPSPRGGIAS
jgi:diguanylate cyclase (GGDEF)-like protein